MSEPLLSPLHTLHAGTHVLLCFISTVHAAFVPIKLMMMMMMIMMISMALGLRQPGKVKFSHTRYRALGPELIPVYRQSARR